MYPAMAALMFMRLYWLTVALTNGRLILMTQESVQLKKIPKKEKEAAGQKTSFKHISSIWLCSSLNDGIIVQIVVTFCKSIILFINRWY